MIASPRFAGGRRRVLLRLALAALLTACCLGESLAASCKSYRTCREAVVAWCAGRHPGADGDSDGIPCENVCRSRAEVAAIMREIGCSR
ncbi:hypothetical protein [Mangrovibrevibacter kandeliae]|uniref:hypothetical protein n=1 Tax=Mangrovibrevibacter kandeliae TaxID=2968473 RepID=UPI002118A0A5|nr:hypothetical protein [Aurantimonas sp. CSK15Z-1]MCQ8782860.1 hypothetical protein [Aurantimonas sp. CSK15Z-1]